MPQENNELRSEWRDSADAMMFLQENFHITNRRIAKICGVYRPTERDVSAITYLSFRGWKYHYGIDSLDKNEKPILNLELEPKGPDLHAEDKKDSAFDRAEREQGGYSVQRVVERVIYKLDALKKVGCGCGPEIDHGGLPCPRFLAR